MRYVFLECRSLCFKTRVFLTARRRLLARRVVFALRCGYTIDRDAPQKEKQADDEIRNEAAVSDDSNEIASAQMHQLTEEEERKLEEAIQRNRVPSLHADRIISSCFRMRLSVRLSSRQFE